MGGCIGPCSTLPGYIRKPEKGAMCDEHPDRPSVASVQGETDSFGAELIDYCQECLDEHSEAMIKAQEEEDWCEICKTQQKYVAPCRDAEEGMAGPVYYACPRCRAKLRSFD